MNSPGDAPEWPEGWDPDEGWPSLKDPTHIDGPLSTWGVVAYVLRRDHGQNISAVIHALGGPEPSGALITLETCDREIRSYFQKHGKRPSHISGRRFSRLHQWLYRQGNTLSQRCDELGIPRSTTLGRTMESCDEEIRSFFKKTGERPSMYSSKEFVSINGWLRHNYGTTLANRCDALGLPRRHVLDRTLESCDEKILTHFKNTGIRPMSRDSRELRGIDLWLMHNHNSSLSKRCDALGMPPSPRRGIEQCLVKECPEPHYAKGYCSNHFYRWKRYGDPLALMRRRSKSTKAA